VVYLTTPTAECIEQPIARIKQNEKFQIRREASSCHLNKKKICIIENSQIAIILTRNMEQERRNWKMKVIISCRLGKLTL